jgi:uncharacterized membrane protein YhaH (DUF805 family)
VKNLGFFTLYAVLVGLGIDGVADEMGIVDARAGQCFELFAAFLVGWLVVALSSDTPLANVRRWHDAGQIAATTALCLPWVVWLGASITPPQAMFIAIFAAIAAAGLPTLVRWILSPR